MTFDTPAIEATAFLLKSSSRSVRLYVRFPLSLRMVEDFLAVRGITVSHETVRRCLRDLLVSTRSQVASLPANASSWLGRSGTLNYGSTSPARRDLRFVLRDRPVRRPISRIADSEATRTQIPIHCGQHSDDCGQLMMNC